MDINQAQIDADNAAVAVAQSGLASANAALSAAESTLAADSLTFAAEQQNDAKFPVLVVLNQIELYVADSANNVPITAAAAISAFVEQARAHVIPVNTTSPTVETAPDAESVATEQPTPTEVAYTSVEPEAGGGNGPP